jgi:hypothetical protein
MKEWSVWVGGVEVNDYYLDKTTAEQVAAEYRTQGYDDVIVWKGAEQ